MGRLKKVIVLILFFTFTSATPSYQFIKFKSVQVGQHSFGGDGVLNAPPIGVLTVVTSYSCRPNFSGGFGCDYMTLGVQFQGSPIQIINHNYRLNVTSSPCFSGLDTPAFLNFQYDGTARVYVAVAGGVFIDFYAEFFKTGNGYLDKC